MRFQSFVPSRVPAGRSRGVTACGSPCVPANGGNAIADADLADWMNAIAAALPAGSADVAFTAPSATTPAIYVITVNWTEVGQDDPATYQLRVEI